MPGDILATGIGKLPGELKNEIVSHLLDLFYQSRPIASSFLLPTNSSSPHTPYPYNEIPDPTSHTFLTLRSKVEERQSLGLLSLNKFFVPLGRAALYSTICITSHKRARKLLDTLEMEIKAWDGHKKEVVKLRGLLKTFVRRIQIELIDYGPGNDSFPLPQDLRGASPSDIKWLARILQEKHELYLDCSTSGGAPAVDRDMLIALRTFNNITTLQVTGPIGFKNTWAIYTGMRNLKRLSLKEVMKGATTKPTTFHEAAEFFASLEADPNINSLRLQLDSLTLYDCQFTSDELRLLFHSINPSSLRHLAIRRLRQLVPPLPEIPFPAPLLSNILQPFLLNLTSLDLVTFDRAPITDNAHRQMLLNRGLLHKGNLLLPLPNNIPYLLNILAPAFGPDLIHLTVGGPLALTPDFFNLLPSSSSTASGGLQHSLKSLRLTLCANKTPSNATAAGAAVDGITSAEFLDALNAEWAHHLTELTFFSMEDETFGQDPQPVWDFESYSPIIARVDEINEERKQEGGNRGELKVWHDTRPSLIKYQRMNVDNKRVRGNDVVTSKKRRKV